MFWNNKWIVHRTLKIRDIMLPVGWPWAPMTIVSKFVVMKKCTSASQEFLESSLNQEYYHPKWPLKGLWDSTGKLGPQIDLKLSTWRWFVRFQPYICGKPSKKSRIRETLTLLTCADRRTKITPFWHICYGHLCIFFFFKYSTYITIWKITTSFWYLFHNLQTGRSGQKITNNIHICICSILGLWILLIFIFVLEKK